MDSTDLDPYLDPTTGILRNLIGATSKSELDRAEGDLVFGRWMRLRESSAAAVGDLAELQSIHFELFRDVYDWAGQLRTVDIRKNVEGGVPFLPVSMIGRAATYAAAELRADGLLHGLDRSTFVERLAYHYDAFNYIHPFREGNGRAQRVFWDRLARGAGWTLDWRSVRGETNDMACRAASDLRDFEPLRTMFDGIVEPWRDGVDSLSRLALDSD